MPMAQPTGGRRSKRARRGIGRERSRPESVPGIDEVLRAHLADAYRIDRAIGRGGAASVYLAERRCPPGWVAVKVPHPERASPVWLRRLKREGRFLKQLRSTFTLRCIEDGLLPDGRPFLVLEYLEGRSLDALSAGGVLPPGRVLRLALQAAAALAELHALGIVHRDIKPENLFVLDGHPPDRVRLMDLGLATWIGSSPEDLQSEMIVGTPRYMAPEQWLRPEDVDPLSDVFSLGLVLYELLARDSPWPGGDTRDVIRSRVSTPPIALEARTPPPSLPAAVYRLVNRMVSPEPAERPAHMDEVVGELLEAVALFNRRERLHVLGAESSPGGVLEASL